MSPSKKKSTSSMDQPFRSGFNAVKDFLTGRAQSVEEPEIDATGPQLAPEPDEPPSMINSSEGDRGPTTGDRNDNQLKKTTPRVNDRRRKMDGRAEADFEHLVRNLREGKSATQRAAAVRALGTSGSQLAIPHLIAAMFDDEPEVRRVAEEVLGQIGELHDGVGAVTNGPKNETTATLVNITEASLTVFETGMNGPGLTSDEADVRPSEPDLVLRKATQFQIVPDPAATEEERQLIQEQLASRAKAEELEHQLFQIVAARTEQEAQARLRIEREAQLRAEAGARIREEEESRRRVEEEARIRHRQEAEAVEVERLARMQAEAEAVRLAQEESRLRLEAAVVVQAVEEILRRHTAAVVARQEAMEASKLSEANSARTSAEERHKAEIAQLQNEEAELRTATEEASRRRAEVEVARAQAERDAEELVEAQSRMRVAEETRAHAEAKRKRLEEELRLRVETEGRLLEETRERVRQEEQRLAGEAQQRTEAEELRLAKLEAARKEAELHHQQVSERELQLASEIDGLRTADAEARKRITEVETRKHTAEQAYRKMVEEIQRLEAEAKAAAAEEESMRVRLEMLQRTSVSKASAKAEQEKQFNEEIEKFHSLENDERARLETVTLQRTAAESRLLEQQVLVKAEEAARQAVVAQIKILDERQSRFREPSANPPGDVMVADVPEAIISYLQSADPYKRAASVAELARTNAKDAFGLIAKCFDDQSPQVRNAAALALHKLEPTRTVDLFNRAVGEGSEDRRRNIGAAIAASGLATEAINNLGSERREDTYKGLSILFVMAKSGEVRPLIQAVEEHQNAEVCRAVIKLLTLSGNSELGDAALQRRALGLAGSRQKVTEDNDEISQSRLRLAALEVKRAVGGKRISHHSANRKQTLGGE